MKRAYLLLCFVALSGFTSQPMAQPKEERQAQNTLPQSHDDTWKMLGQCKVTTDAKTY